MTDLLPLIPLKNVAIFPHGVMPLSIGRKKSLRATNVSLENYESYLIVCLQKSPEVEDPMAENLYRVGTKVKIIQSIALQEDGVRLLIEGKERVEIQSVIEQERCLMTSHRVLKDIAPQNDLEVSALNHLCERLIEQFSLYGNVSKSVHPEIVATLLQHKDPSHTTNIISSYIGNCSAYQKQQILEEMDLKERTLKLLELLQKEIMILQTDQEIDQKIRSQIEKAQKEYYLKEKINAIQKELESVGEKSDISQLEEKIEQLKLSQEAKEKAQSELKKYKLMSPMSAEASVLRNYLDTLLSLPWGKKTEESLVDLNKAQQLLNAEHYGLEKVKERIIEYLAVLKRSQKIKGPILFLVGPPGVGKTSLASSIAKATGRVYIKCSLGGVHDEAEIRGHRKTYVGAMTGKIIAAMKKAGTDNPVILLDEIDKMGSDFRGDPTSALLEVLDPEQNSKFLDNYLEVGYDLSQVMFVAAANSFNCPTPLLDRMEIIRLSGYLDEEKLQIAKIHLIPKQISAHGLEKGEFSLTDSAILQVIKNYTKESGVRNLEREIGTLARKSLVKILNKETTQIRVTKSNIPSFLGQQKYRITLPETQNQVGVTTGLAYTEVGGELLSIEALLVPGKGEIHTTGKLGMVMKESAQAAFSFFKSIASSLGISPSAYKDQDIHLHVPQGAIPKDGPSAGVAIFTTIVSVMTNSRVKNTVAMTGEITLRGKVLAIGGLKEKLFAAQRVGITTVILPKENEKDLEEIPTSIKEKLTIVPISMAEEALSIALEGFDRFKIYGNPQDLPIQLQQMQQQDLNPSL
jgi:ATP-dependent Lon protease